MNQNKNYGIYLKRSRQISYSESDINCDEDVTYK